MASVQSTEFVPTQRGSRARRQRGPVVQDRQGTASLVCDLDLQILQPSVSSTGCHIFPSDHGGPLSQASNDNLHGLVVLCLNRSHLNVGIA